MKRKILLLITILLLVLSLSACKIETVEQYESKNSTSKNQVSTTVKTDELESTTTENVTLSENINTTTKNIVSTTKQVQSSQETTTVENTTTTTTTTVPITVSDKITVSISIDCSKAVDHKNLKSGISLPQNGVVLNLTSATVKKNTTVLSVTQRVCNENNVPYFEYSGYFSKLGPIGEKDCGPTSGWTYHINGKFVGLGASDYRLKDGDVITWVYSPEN